MLNFFHLRVVSLYGGSWKSLSLILKRIFIYVMFTFPLQTLSILSKMKMILMIVPAVRVDALFKTLENIVDGRF